MYRTSYCRSEREWGKDAAAELLLNACGSQLCCLGWVHVTGERNSDMTPEDFGVGCDESSELSVQRHLSKSWIPSGDWIQ